MLAKNVSADDYAMRRGCAKRAMSSTSIAPATGASQSASSAQPRKKAKASKGRPEFADTHNGAWAIDGLCL
jgi:hypothetical protein